MNTHKTYQQGFTLVELSIGLLIVALLIGSVTVATSMLNSASLQRVVKEYSGFVAATETFQAKYNAIPGDMPDAASYWGTADNCPGTNAQPSITTTTCNGDGDGWVDATGSSHEEFRFWQHLSNAGLLEGDFSGVTGPGGANDVVATFNTPFAAIDGSAWSMFFRSTIAGNAEWVDITNTNLYLLGAEWGTSWNDDPSLTPAEAYELDKKLDDGFPNAGKVLVHYWDDCTDMATSADVSSTYDLSVTGVNCALAITEDFR